MRAWITCVAIVSVLATHSAAVAAAENPDGELAALIREVDSAANAPLSDDARSKLYESLQQRADRLVAQNPDRAEPLVWKGIVLANRSAIERSLGMLKQARKTLEAAAGMKPNGYALDAYVTLGSLYANAPGFPLSFGDKKKAKAVFEQALAIDPTNIGANLNLAQLLFKTDDFTGALKYANAALAAPSRSGRDQADKAARIRAERDISKCKVADRHREFLQSVTYRPTRGLQFSGSINRKSLRNNQASSTDNRCAATRQSHETTVVAYRDSNEALAATGGRSPAP